MMIEVSNNILIMSNLTSIRVIQILEINVKDVISVTSKLNHIRILIINLNLSRRRMIV
jgi:hypothetical protein